MGAHSFVSDMIHDDSSSFSEEQVMATAASTCACRSGAVPAENCPLISMSTPFGLFFQLLLGPTL